MDKLVCIETFIKIVEEGSLRKAAQALHQTEAAISKRLTRLEEELNLPLLERGRNGIKLTPIGERYFLICKEVTEKLNLANQLIQSTKIEPQGELNVSCIQYFFEQAILPKLAKFQKDYPHIQLKFITTERIPNFKKEKIDILFGIAMPFLGQEDELIRKKIGKTRDILCASPQYLKKSGVPKKLNDLLGLNYIAHTAQQPANTIYLNEKAEIYVQPFLRLDNHNAIIKAALSHLGYIFTKEYMVENYLKSGKLVEILPNYPREILPIYLYYRHQAYQDPKIQAFLNHFLSL